MDELYEKIGAMYEENEEHIWKLVVDLEEITDKSIKRDIIGEISRAHYISEQYLNLMKFVKYQTK